MKFAAIVFVLLTTAGLGAAADSASTFAGMWRGNMEVMRPDGRRASVYAGVNLENGDTGWSGLIRTLPEAASSDLSAIQVEGSHLSFRFNLGDQPARFRGQVEGSSLSGVVQAGDFETTLNLERAIRLEREQLDERWGVYDMEDGGRILLAPAPWYFDYYDLSSGAYAAAFPRTEFEFFTGSGSSQLVPVQRELALTKSAQGEWSLRVEESGQTRRGERTEAILTREVSFASGDLTIAGTLFEPSGNSGRAPGIVSMVGSGRQDRLGFNRLNVHRAAWLAGRGYAVLIYDKRGIGDSEGEYGERTPENMASDLAAAAAFLAVQPQVDAPRVGILVHSQSGIYAPTAIQMTDAIRYAVVLSTTVVNGEIQEIIRTRQQLEADGWPKQDIDDAVATQILKFYYANHRIGWDAYVAAYHRVKDKPWFENIIGSTIDPERSSWDFWRNGNGYEPSDEWAKVSVPVLFFFGDKDLISPVQRSIALLEEKSFGGERSGLLTVHLLENVAHDMFVAVDGGAYDEVQFNQMSDYLDRTLEWIEANGLAK